jgi:cell division protein FtsB
MSKRLSTILAFLSSYKYVITVVVGVLFVGFLDENSFLQRLKYDMQISGLKEEIQKYKALNDSANTEIENLRRDPRYIEKIARERYLMKADDEDIFVFSTDKINDDLDKQPTE